MPFKRLLIANRGEIAIRVAQAAAELDIPTVAVYATDDAQSLHIRKADVSVALDQAGPAAYLNGEQLLSVVREYHCDAIHPGYGFLSESAEFARLCEQAGIFFIGPSPAVLDVFGDKASARQLAKKHGVPLIHGTNEPTSLEAARSFLESLGEGGAVMLKAIAGGGGRGMRPVYSNEELEPAFHRCRSEASAAFGNGDLYVEQLIPEARHIEVQIIGDGTDVTHLWERDCTLQRRHQKVMEMAPAPGLAAGVREQLLADAEMLGRAVGYRGLCTVEFLVDTRTGQYVFLEANPRVQVEHTVTEAITGLDLVQLQIRIAAGLTLADAGITSAPEPRGQAVQLRINLETMAADGSARPTGGQITAYEPPSGPGIRVDGYGYSGYVTSPAYDSLLVKLIVHSEGDYPALLRRAYRALCEFRLDGVPTNIPFLQNLLQHSQVRDNIISTRFIDAHGKELAPADENPHPSHYFSGTGPAESNDSTVATGPEGSDPVTSPVQGIVVSIDVEPGQVVVEGQQVAILEAMKMEFVINAGQSGRVVALTISAGDAVYEDHPLMFIEPEEITGVEVATEESLDLEHIRTDLQQVISLHQQIGDEKRPDAVAKRRKAGQRTARENLADLLDSGSFMEYGALALAAQRTRRSPEELQTLSPADGLVAGIGTVNGHQFGPETSRCMAMSYDYTVFAGTQGVMNHKKTDRMLALAEKQRLPLVFFTEGGGGRPGDVDWVGVAGLDCTTFMRMARLNGSVPLIGIASGRCFAGNAALLGCCDVIIATENATIGMAGPAMIEGGGLGRFMPEEVGPVSVQSANGVIDIVARDEADATRIAKQYLAFFQGDLPAGARADQRELRHLIPENRLRVYDIRKVINALADHDSVLELRKNFAPGLITALVRIQGKAFGVIANNPAHLGGAIDAAGADKAARFMQLCDAHGL
ncbi:MAG: carboxyl transferase domain-containing protein, partial [Marinobacter sp.]